MHRGDEGCSHLFFECPFAQEIWTEQNIPGVDVTFTEALWGSQEGNIKNGREAKWGRILAVLWVIWLHYNEVMFKERMVSENRVELNMGGLVSSWCRGASRV